MFFASASRGEQHSSYIIPLCTGTSFRTGPLPIFFFYLHNTSLTVASRTGYRYAESLMSFFFINGFGGGGMHSSTAAVKGRGMRISLGSNIMLPRMRHGLGTILPAHFDDKNTQDDGEGKGHFLPCTVCVNDQGWESNRSRFPFSLIFFTMFES